MLCLGPLFEITAVLLRIDLNIFYSFQKQKIKPYFHHVYCSIIKRFSRCQCREWHLRAGALGFCRPLSCGVKKTTHRYESDVFCISRQTDVLPTPLGLGMNVAYGGMMKGKCLVAFLEGLSSIQIGTHLTLRPECTSSNWPLSIWLGLLNAWSNNFCLHITLTALHKNPE